MITSDLEVLLTGATGTLGQAICRKLMSSPVHPKRLVLFSRDEFKQHQMQVSGMSQPWFDYRIGDVRDFDAIRAACAGVHGVIHAAALKQVPTCEEHPEQAEAVNVTGTWNVVRAAVDQRVEKVLFISSDKAVEPLSAYGATKMLAERLVLQAGARQQHTKLACVRFGNIIGSRGSVIPILRERAKTGRVTITDPRMTRFWISDDECAKFVMRCMCSMAGGEIFIPKMPTMSIMDLAQTLSPGVEMVFSGIRAGEKVDEAIVSEDEVRRTTENAEMFTVAPMNSRPTNTVGQEFCRTSGQDSDYKRETLLQWLAKN